MNLNDGNYFSTESSRAYMSASQLKSFLDCPARTLAEISGAYRRETSTALLVGSYVDSHFSGTLPQFRADHPEIYTLKGGLRSEFGQAEEIIEYLSADPLLMRMLQGEQQRIVTGEIAGVQFKGKLDCLLSAEQCHQIAEDYPEMAADLMMADGAIVDLKCLRDLESIWVNGRGKLSVIEAWRYDLQLAIYQRLVGGKLPCYIVAVTKEKQPDKALIHIPQYMMDAAMEGAKEMIPHFNTLKQGYGSAGRCEKCAWCLQTKVITGAVDADELEGAGV